MDSLIEVTRLRKQQGRFRLDITDFQAPQGGFTVLLGPPGAGKTTFLKLLFGMVFADGGTATVAGYDCRTESRLIRQQAALLLTRPGFLYQARLQRLKQMVRPFYPDWDEEAYQRDLAYFALEERFIYGRLGNEQKKQFALSLALAHQPRLLLLDDIFIKQNQPSQEKISRLLQRRQAQGLTILFATASVAEAAQLAEHLYLLEQGRIVAAGQPEELFRTYAAVVEQALHQARPPANPKERLAALQAINDACRREVEA